jgi:hypothetical protein
VEFCKGLRVGRGDHRMAGGWGEGGWDSYGQPHVGHAGDARKQSWEEKHHHCHDSTTDSHDDISNFIFIGGDKKGKSLNMVRRSQLVRAICMERLSIVMLNMWNSLTMDCTIWLLLKVSPEMKIVALSQKMSTLTTMLCTHFKDNIPQLTQREELILKIKNASQEDIIEWAINEGFRWTTEDKEPAKRSDWRSNDGRPPLSTRVLEKRPGSVIFCFMLPAVYTSPHT